MTRIGSRFLIGAIIENTRTIDSHTRATPLNQIRIFDFTPQIKPISKKMSLRRNTSSHSPAQKRKSHVNSQRLRLCKIIISSGSAFVNIYYPALLPLAIVSVTVMRNIFPKQINAFADVPLLARFAKNRHEKSDHRLGDRFGV